MPGRSESEREAARLERERKRMKKRGEPLPPVPTSDPAPPPESAPEPELPPEEPTVVHPAPDPEPAAPEPVPAMPPAWDGRSDTQPFDPASALVEDYTDLEKCIHGGGRGEYRKGADAQEGQEQTTTNPNLLQ